MKVLLVLACTLALSHALDAAFKQQFKQKMQEVGAKCVEQEKPSDDDVGLLLSHQIPNTHEGKCVIYCVYKHFNTINEDGSINIEGGMQALQPVKENDEVIYEKFVTIFKKCADSTSNDGDPCNTATHLIKCVLEEGKAMGLSADMFD